MKKKICLVVVVIVVCLFLGGCRADRAFPPIGDNAGGHSYWSFPMFANALRQGSWMYLPDSSSWGTSFTTLPSPQFSQETFLPQFIDAGQARLRAIVYSLHVGCGSNCPPNWPNRSAIAGGVWTVSWKGTADVRLMWASYIGGNVSTGLVKDGMRVYFCAADGNSPGALDIYAIDAADPLTELYAMMPDPAAPLLRSLPTSTTWHPSYLAILKERRWAFLRAMDLASTNNNPQSNWMDRRLPRHSVQNGVINTRAPCTGGAQNQNTGMAWELIVDLANTANLPLWINVPHLATDEYIRNLAQLILYGSNGSFPYSSQTSSPEFAPLSQSLDLFLEYSNEIWSSGGSFLQGNWAQEQASALGISKSQFNARRFCHVFAMFQEIFGAVGQESRLKRVAAIWAGSSSYTDGFMAEMASSCQTSTPPTAPDIIAPTTYFGNDIQGWAWKRPSFWSHLPSDPYWLGSELEDNLQEIFNEFDMRQLSESAATGSGPDATAGMSRIIKHAKEIASQFALGPLRVVSYEGGPSIYTNSYDDNTWNNTGITRLMEAMNRHPRMKTAYSIALNLAFANGLETHGMFTDVGSWSRYGQWGHMEQVDVPSVKMQFIADTYDEFSNIRVVGDALGEAPHFSSPELALAKFGSPYSQSLGAAGGNGALRLKIIAQSNMCGITAQISTGDVRGTPAGYGYGYSLVRVVDADGDAAWRTFRLRYYGQPGAVVDANFDGEHPGLHIPWSNAYFERSGVAFGGLSFGPAVSGRSGNDSLCFSMASSATELSLQDAVGNGDYVSAVINATSSPLNLRHGFVRFAVLRYEYHAPRNWAVFSSVTGFSVGNELFNSDFITSQSTQFLHFSLPDDPALELQAGSSIEFRIVGYKGQYSHAAALTEFLVSEHTNEVPPCTTPDQEGIASSGNANKDDGSSDNVNGASRIAGSIALLVAAKMLC